MAAAPREELARSRGADHDRSLVVVDPTGELARLLLRQKDRAAELLDGVDEPMNGPIDPAAWLQSVALWRLETRQVLADWFDGEVLAEFAVATGASEARGGLAEHAPAMRTALRNGVELIRALYSTQTAYRGGRGSHRAPAGARPGLSDPRHVA